jgi:hypothetical protein
MMPPLRESGGLRLRHFMRNWQDFVYNNDVLCAMNPNAYNDRYIALHCTNTIISTTTSNNTSSIMMFYGVYHQQDDEQSLNSSVATKTSK